MLKFSVTILGCASALPTVFRNPTAQVITYNTSYYLLDCAEGTQRELRKNKISILKINHIFISHLHGDHFYGIFGLLSTFNMLGRKNVLNIYAPADLKKMYEFILNSNNDKLDYEINFIPLIGREKKLIMSDKYLDIYSFPLKHSKKVWGFLFSEKQKPLNIKKEVIEKYGLSIKDIVKIKNGEDYTDISGNLIKNKQLTNPSAPIRSYVFCTDTLAVKAAVKNYLGADLLYHEATYCSDNKLLAKKTFHSTAADAANIAKLANAKKLLIGHYSSRYDSSECFCIEAKEIFENTVAAYDGMEIEIISESLI